MDRKAAKEALEDVLSEKIKSSDNFSCLDDLTPDEREKLTYDDVLWMQIRNKACNGDMKAMQEILDRRFGKAPQYIQADVRTFSYTDFLTGIQEEEAQELPPITITETVPRVEERELSETGGVSGNDLLDDLGLL